MLLRTTRDARLSDEQGRKSNLGAAAEMPVQISTLELEKLFREHHALVFRAAYRIAGNANDAEDVLQTVFLRILRRPPDADAVDHVKTYLYRAAVNAALDLIKSRQAARNIPLEDVEMKLTDNPSQAADRAVDSGEIREWLRRAVGRLSPNAAEIFTLRFFEGKANPEIAEMLGTTQNTVAVTLSRARERIQREFKAYRGDA
jgi:RNA polymerase sigma-70 factor (ECF subfamily)